MHSRHVQKLENPLSFHVKCYQPWKQELQTEKLQGFRDAVIWHHACIETNTVNFNTESKFFEKFLAYHNESLDYGFAT